MRIKLRKLLSAALILAFLANMLTPALAADKAEAVTIRLSKTEGKGVSVTTNADKSVKLSDNMRVFNGYKILTDKASYAFFSLDDKRAVKLDKSSEVEVKKSGDKNELYLSSGQLFFNVKEKLKENEEVNLVTSNMVMGIRGTSGVVSTVNVYGSNGEQIYTLTKIQIYDGKAKITVVNPSTGAIETYDLPAGSQLIIKDYTITEDGTVEVIALAATDIPSFAALEIIIDAELAKRILDDSNISLEQLKELLESIIESELSESKSWQSHYDSASGALNKIIYDNIAMSDQAPLGSNDILSQTSIPASNSEPTEQPPFAAISSMTEAQLIAQLLDENITVITIPSGSNITLNANLTLAPGKTLNINGSLALNADFRAYGRINNNTNTFTQQDGSIILGDGAVFHNNGRIIGDQALIADGNAAIENLSGKTIPSVAITENGYLTLINNGAIAALSAETGARLLINSAGTIPSAFTDENFIAESAVQGREYAWIDDSNAWAYNREYEITYNLGGGSNNSINKTKYKKFDGINLAPASIPGQVFVGWFFGSDYVAADEIYYGIGNSSGDITVNAFYQTPVTDSTSLNAAIAALPPGVTEAPPIVLTQDVTVTSTLQIPNTGSYVIRSSRGKQYALKRHLSLTTGNVVRVAGISSSVCKLVLDNVKLDGASIGAQAAVVNAENSTLVLTGGTVITGGSNQNNGGGIYADGSDIIIDNASITNTTISGSGGGVYLTGDSSLTMNGGSIFANTALTKGGGVYIGAGCTFNLNGGTISNNTAIYGDGGVCNDGGTYNRNGGLYYENVPEDFGP